MKSFNYVPLAIAIINSIIILVDVIAWAAEASSKKYFWRRLGFAPIAVSATAWASYWGTLFVLALLNWEFLGYPTL